ncbi:MAG: YcaO-like family protein [Pseudomonadota bacterium]
MTATLPHMPYSYAHANTQATTGYFSCLPPANLNTEGCLAWLCDHANDSFMHRHLLRKFAQDSIEQNINYIKKLQEHSPQTRAVFAAIVYEITILDPKRLSLREHIETLCPDCQGDMGDYLCAFTPLPYIAWSKQEDCELHQAWIDIFSNNIQKHHLLPHPEDDDLPLLYSAHSEDNSDAELENPNKSKSLAEIHAEMLALAAAQPQDFPAWQRPPAQETADRALAVLQANNIIADIEMRHEASLSPIALLRRWNLSIDVDHDGASHSLQGEANTYGRGLSVADARASYLMEMVERASSYANIGPHGLLNLAACDAFHQAHDLRPIFADGSRTYEQSLDIQLRAQLETRQEPLIHGRYSELVEQGHKVLNPLDIPSEAPYADQPLYWVTGYSPCHDAESPTMTSYEPVLVPVQLIYLFNNLDEIDLSMAPSSTGLASGNTFAEAKLSALTEIIERDAEATSPYSRQHCFRAESHDPRLMALLNDYAARGMHLHFQDMTSFTGVPCYTAFVMGTRGVLARGTGAGLDAKRAALSAMTETPYPYPHGGPSAPALRGLESKKLEELPSFTLSSPEQNVMMLERVLIAKGLRPIYFNLTQSRFGLPVVKAIVPYMEPTAEFDQFSRVSKKLFANYLKIFA